MWDGAVARVGRGCELIGGGGEGGEGAFAVVAAGGGGVEAAATAAARSDPKVDVVRGDAFVEGNSVTTQAALASLGAANVVVVAASAAGAAATAAAAAAARRRLPDPASAPAFAAPPTKPQFVPLAFG